MAFLSNNSPSPSSSSDRPSSITSSCSSLPTPLTPLSMARPPSTEPQASRKTPPNRSAVDLPRTQTASKGGCWTCRLRRKKCDEQRQGDDCQTCIRLKIKCLGWGSKRPEWMRDKQAVDAYKADIKSQLTSAGLVHGLRRPSTNATPAAPAAPPVPPAPPPQLSQPHPTRSRSQRSYHQNLPSAPPAPGPSSSRVPQLEMDSSTVDFTFRYLDSGAEVLPNGHATNLHSSMVPELTGGSPSGLHRPPMTAYNDTSLSSPLFSYIPSLIPSLLSTSSSGTSDGVHYDFSPLDTQQASGHDTTAATAAAVASTSPQFHFDLPVSSPTHAFAPLAGQSTLQGDHVFYYFEQVRKLQYIFAGNAVTNVTYSMIVDEPRGAVTNAVCALAALHYRRMRIAQGLEAPDPNPEHSMAKFFHDEAYYQLVNAKQLRGHYNESDAIAALHLVSFSLLSGGNTDWRTVLTVALDWLGQTGLVGDENPRLAMFNMSFASRCALKKTMWLDIFSSLTLGRPPQFLALYRRLLAGGGGGNGSGAGFWVGSDLNDDSGFDLRMESLTGCPDDVMLAIAEVSALAHWKEAESCNRSLSVRELVRRGDEIERRLRQRSVEPAKFTEVDPVPLHPSLPPMQSTLNETGHAVLPFPDENMRRSAANIFREGVILYLHTVLSDNYPGVPEISESVGKIIQLLEQLPQSEVDRSLVFPICLAGCMTDDPVRRDVLKTRLQAQDQSVGNLLLTCAVMDTVWRKRDGHVGAVIDWRESMRDHHLNLLLV